MTQNSAAYEDTQRLDYVIEDVSDDDLNPAEADVTAKWKRVMRERRRGWVSMPRWAFVALAGFAVIGAVFSILLATAFVVSW